MIVGVTGGNGFIGTWVRNVLEANGHSSIVLDHRGHDGMLGDVKDFGTVFEFAAHVDAIIHLAAVLGTSETIAMPLPALETNIYGTINVFEAASHYDLPVVFAAVGNSGIGRGTYCVTKTCGEEFVGMYREDRGLRVAAVRPMNAYGPRQSAPQPFGSSKVRKIVPSFVCSALSAMPMSLYGGGTQVSDSVWVGDVARVFVKTLEALASGVVPDHPIDVGNKNPYTVMDIANEVRANVSGAVIESVPMRLGEPHGGPVSTQAALDRLVSAVEAAEPSLRSVDVRRIVRRLGTVVSADTSTLEVVGENADNFVPLDEGIARTVKWFRQNEGITWRFQK